MLRPSPNGLTPSDLRLERTWRDLDDRTRVPLTGGVGIRTTLGQTLRPLRSHQLFANLTTTTRKPFQIIGPYLDGSDWKIGITVGTLNGLTPVVGDVESTGGTTLSATSRLTLATGEEYVCLGIKTDLETREIARLTVQTREDITPIVDTGARTRITFEPIAQLLEVVTPTTRWTLLNQIAETNLKYFTAGTSDIVWRA